MVVNGRGCARGLVVEDLGCADSGIALLDALVELVVVGTPEGAARLLDRGSDISIHSFLIERKCSRALCCCVDRATEHI